ncbi:MAG: hypothetical protein ACI81P_003141 [Neolewinella sp.]|jgi:hypothetical protein
MILVLVVVDGSIRSVVCEHLLGLAWWEVAVVSLCRAG